jgi:NADH-quinone oxidoreductase subunit M
MSFVSLTGLIFSPLVLAGGLLCIPDSKSKYISWVALALSVLVFGYSLLIAAAYEPSLVPTLQHNEKVPWMVGFGIFYNVAIDGLSLGLVLLTTFLTPLVILASVTYIQKSRKLYYVLLLILETTMLGTLVAQDLFLFYVFWESMLFPMLLIIGIWGGERRIYASLKFFLYTLVGSLLMLVGIFVLMAFHKEQMGFYSADFQDLYKLMIPGGIRIFDMQSLLFMAFMFAFAVKVPVFPLHTWLPDAHVEAPTGGSVILAGILLKMGIYAMVRLALPLFPQATLAYAPWLVGLGIVGIIYGSCMALAQEDVKKLVAYSSVSHLGYCVVGIFVLNMNGLNGSMVQMLSHGLTTGALFTLVGFLYERFHTRHMGALGGLARLNPMWVVMLVAITLGSIGLPSTSGFVGEFLVLMGGYQVHWGIALLSGLGVVLGSVYMLWMVQKICFGQASVTTSHLRPPDLSLREWAALLPYVVMMFGLGMGSPWVVKYMEPSLMHLLSRVEGIH